MKRFIIVEIIVVAALVIGFLLVGHQIRQTN